MNNKVSALAFLNEAEIILEESRLSFERGHWHRVVRKSQEATELAIKGLFKYLGLDYPKSHILGKVIKKELAKHHLFDKEVLNQIAFISDSLAFDREPFKIKIPFPPGLYKFRTFKEADIWEREWWVKSGATKRDR